MYTQNALIQLSVTTKFCPIRFYTNLELCQYIVISVNRNIYAD